MNTQLTAVLCRLAALTSIIRTQADDAARAERNGDELHARVENLVSQLEEIATKLEESLA